MNIDQIRVAFTSEYPDTTLPGDDENSCEAIGIVLMAAIHVGINPETIAAFTGYNIRFVRAVSINMANNGFWKNGKYDFSAWSADGELPTTSDIDKTNKFWSHIQMADGAEWMPDANADVGEDASSIFYYEQAKSRRHC